MYYDIRKGRKYMNSLNSISPAGLAVLSALVSVAFVFALDNESLDVLGNVFVGIGGIMLIASAQGDYLDEIGKIKQQKELLEKQLEALSKRRGNALL